MIATTDTKHYIPLTDSIYRYTPFTMELPEVKMIHGINERIPVKQYGKAINYFKHLMQNADQFHIKQKNKHTHAHEL